MFPGCPEHCNAEGTHSECSRNIACRLDCFLFYYEILNFLITYLILLFDFTSLFFQNNSLRLKDTHKEKAPSNKTPAFTKSTNMSIWVVGTSCWYIESTLYKRFLNRNKISKKTKQLLANSVLCDRSVLYSPFHLS